MEIKAEWFMDEDGQPTITIDVGEVEESLTRREAYLLASKIQGCLNGIIHHLARYMIVSGGGKKDHLALKDGYTSSSTTICGYSRGVWAEGDPKQWYGARPLQSQPDPHGICARCIAKYERLEAAQSA